MTSVTELLSWAKQAIESGIDPCGGRARRVQSPKQKKQKPASMSEQAQAAAARARAEARKSRRVTAVTAPAGNRHSVPDHRQSLKAVAFRVEWQPHLKQKENVS
jgi:hypothetical protein